MSISPPLEYFEVNERAADCNGHTAVQVTDLLKKQGYLQDTPGSKKKGFAKTGLSRFMVPDSERVRQRLREEIFNPWVKLAHHVSEAWVLIAICNMQVIIK